MECKLVKSLSKTVETPQKKWKLELSYDLPIPPVGSYSTERKANLVKRYQPYFYNTSHSSQEIEEPKNLQLTRGK